MKVTRGKGRALPLLVVLTACGGSSVASSTIGLDAGSVQGQPDGSPFPRPSVDAEAPDGARSEGAGLDGASPTTPVSDVFVNATIEPAYDANDNNLCVWESTRAALTIGANGGVSAAPTRQVDGSSEDQDGGLVGVLCSVTGSFDVAEHEEALKTEQPDAGTCRAAVPWEWGQASAACFLSRRDLLREVASA